MQSFMRFCAFGLALMLCGCVNEKRPVPSRILRTGISLEIQAIVAPIPGYITTYGSNGQMYGYRYSGGDGRGNLNVSHSEGPINVQLALAAAANFTIGDVQFTDGGGQLSYIKETTTRGRIHDDNKPGVQLDAYYVVKVLDSSVDIYCDPRIVNN